MEISRTFPRERRDPKSKEVDLDPLVLVPLSFELKTACSLMDATPKEEFRG
jgi:hypothetical protein